MKVEELLGEVRAEIVGGTERVIAGVKESLVNRELKEREAAVLSVLGKLQDAERDAKKIKPDNEVFDGDGKAVARA